MIRVIQFITDERLLIPGTGSVGVKGQILEIGPGKAGANFPYRSPLEQQTHYQSQMYVLLRVIDDDGEDLENDDIGVNLDGGPEVIDELDVASGPQGVHDVMSERGKKNIAEESKTIKTKVLKKRITKKTISTGKTSGRKKKKVTKKN